MAKKTVKAEERMVGDANTLLRLCLQYQLDAPYGALVPALIGPSGSGKTQRGLGLAATMGFDREHFVRWLLSQELPEDVGGYPRVVEEGNRRMAEFVLTKLVRRAIDEPCFILIDEIDKVRPEVVATILTLIADRTIRGEMLHPGTVMMVAGQPVEVASWLGDETNKALSARCVWFGTNNDWDYVSKQVKLPLDWLRSTELKDVALPVLPASARTMERAMGFLIKYGPTLSVADRKLFLYGCMAPHDADSLLAELGQSCWLDLELAVKKDAMRVVETLSTNELAAQIYVFMRHCTNKDAVKAALVKVLHNGTEDHRRLFMSSMIGGFKKDAPNVGDTVEIAPGITDSDLTQMFRDAIVAAKTASEAEAAAVKPVATPGVKPAKKAKVTE